MAPTPTVNKRKTLKFLTIALALVSVPGLSSCKGASIGTEDNSAAADTLTHHARYLTIADFGNGNRLVEIGSPWTDPAPLARYLLVDADSAVMPGFGSDVAVVRTPVRRAAVFSSVHTSAIAELGHADAVTAIADAQYFPEHDYSKQKLAQGSITDVGSADMPSMELLAASQAQIVLQSPRQELTAAAVPPDAVLVQMADYLETTPIARAEWLLLFGELFDRQTVADSIFNSVIEKYSDLALKVKLSNEPRPKILVETEYSGTWWVPAGQSYQARMLADAGANYPWADTEGTGSLALSLENVVDKAGDADMWLVRSYGYETTRETLASLNPRYRQFRPWKENSIYSCNSAERLLFNEMAFHPERVLSEYVSLFHPSLVPNYTPRYYLAQ